MPSDDDARVPFVEHRAARWLGAEDGYVLVRFVMLRLLGVVYASAFLVAALQGRPLIGESGLLPAPLFLERVRASIGLADAILKLPTLFWLGYSDTALAALSWVGFALSIAVVLGATNAAVQGALWLLYLSIAQVGQRFYGYGWESQLLETGFLSIFLCPMGSLHPFEKAPPFVVIVLSRWLIARIMLGAGLIKIRGDACWTDLTCLAFHYETQPIPHPLSPYFHAMPLWFHKAGVVFNHLVEIGAPFAAFGPRRTRLVAGTMLVAFQGFLIASGNLSFLNWLTIVPALACFDDRALERLLPRFIRSRATDAQPPGMGHHRAAIGYAAVVALLSISPVLNLLSPRQAMNRSFDPLHLVNTYGAFGSVGRERHEVVLEGTSDVALRPDTKWVEYTFPCKPGAVDRPHCFITPYHRRLDWQMWFLALGSPAREPWVIHLIAKLLAGDRGPMDLFANDPFPSSPPRFIRARYYRYEMAPPSETDVYWRRSLVGEYLPPLERDNPIAREFLERHGLVE